MKDFVLAWIEKWSSKINGWAWDKRWDNRNRKETTQKDWIKGYKKWKEGLSNEKKETS